MANEKRLIDANELKEKLQEHHDFFVDGVGGFRYLTPKDKARVDEITNCIAEIVNAPAVDAVEVVRCCDCVACKVILDNVGAGHCHCKKRYGLPEVDPTDFCSYGERREEK